jgi:hypothetical protein
MYMSGHESGIIRIYVEQGECMRLTTYEVHVRGELVLTLDAIKKEYERKVRSFWDKDWVQKYVWESKYEVIGEILGALRSLSAYQTEWWVEDPDIRIKDTYQWCLALHACTKYLACDDRYKAEKGWESMDDRFKGIYQKYYYFRRRWVAFLKQIMEYVVLINGGDKKLYADVNVFLERSTKKYLFKGYDWEL